MNWIYIIIVCLILLSIILVFVKWDAIKKWKGWEVWLNLEGWKYITVNLIGNLFPVWFLLIIEFANHGITFLGFINTISQPYTYLILSATFAASTLYLWLKKIKSESMEDSPNSKKISIWMIFYIVILFPVIGFYLSKKDCIEKIGEDCAPVIPVIYFLMFPIVVLVYIYYQLYDFYELEKILRKGTPNPTARVNEEIENLNKEL